jgi:hypothetical protein
MTRVARWMLAVASLLGPVPEASALQASVFRGRIIMSPGGPPVTSMRVRLGPHGFATPRADGSFEGAVPSSVGSILITVDTGDEEWRAWHPARAVAVPRDASVVTEVLVGPSTEAMIRRLFATDAAQREASFREQGVSDSLIRALLDTVRQEFAARTQVREADLAAATADAARRAEIFPELSAALELYVIKLGNLQLAFTYVAGPAFTSDTAFARLKQAILDYNPALEALKSNREAYISAVRTYWDSEALSDELRSTLDVALGDIHEVHVLPLNAILADISDVVTGRARGTEAVQKRQRAVRRIEDFLAAVGPRLTELTRRKTRLLVQLQSI